MPKTKSKAKVNDKRWDVVVFDMATRKVVSVAGTDLPESGSFHTVDKRVDTVLGRINLHNFSVAKVPPGKYGLNSVLEEDDLKR